MGIPVLVVDDEPDIAGILADRLQTTGLDVQVAHDGEEALLAIQQIVHVAFNGGHWGPQLMGHYRHE